MKTNPEAHNAYIRKADEQSGGKLKNVARLMKYWRECRSPRVPLSSFHLEMLLANFGTCAGVKTYSRCLTEAFQLLAARECRPLRDPLGISDNIWATRSRSQQQLALRSVQYSRDHAKLALDAETRGNFAEAKRQWDIVFNGAFPY